MLRLSVVVVAGLATFAGVTAACALLWLHLDSSSTKLAHDQIPGVEADALERAGMTLLPPNETPSISPERGREVAARGRTPDRHPEAPFYLVRFVQSEEAPAVDRLSWVFFIDLGRTPLSATGPYGITPAQAGRPYLLIFVDAHTGEYLADYRG
jgi:hypothetical protein